MLGASQRVAATRGAGVPAAPRRLVATRDRAALPVPNQRHARDFTPGAVGPRRRWAFGGAASREELDTQVEEPSVSRADDGTLASPRGSPVEARAGNGASSVEPLPSRKSSRVPHRWQIVGMMFLSFILCNMDKVNMSVAVIPMSHEFGWTAKERGLVSAAFFWGYTLTQTPAGYLCTKYGGTRVLLAGVVLWSLGTLVAPPAANLGILALCMTRLFVGLGEGLAPSSVTNIMAGKIPDTERARAVSTVFGGLDVGSALGLLICGPLMKYYGWQSVFYLFAVLGFVWACVWPLFKPTACIDDVEKEQASMHSNFQAKHGKSLSMPYGEFLRSLPVWAIIVAHFCYNWGYYTLLAWLPSYFELSLGLDVANSSLLTLIPYITMTLMTPIVGPVADKLVERGWSITRVRKLCQGISFLGPAICMLSLATLTPLSPGMASPLLIAVLVGLMSCAFALSAWARGGLYCNHQDLSPQYASALLGITNTAGAIPGVLGNVFVGTLLDKTNSWALALFLPCASFQLFGLIFYTLFASSKRQARWS